MWLKTVSCVVLSNCQKSYDCDWCKDYSNYQPIDKRILSPKQLDRKDKRKKAKKEKKNSEASKRGKRNRRSGKRAEKKLHELLEGWGLEVTETVMSGQLKSYAKVFGKNKETEKMFEGDRWVKILGKDRKIENKKRQDLNRLYKLTSEDKAVYIKDFCVVMSEELFKGLLLGVVPEVVEIDDKRFSYLHEWFNQDNADMVSMVSNYKPFMFAVTIDFWEEFING